MAAYTVLSTLVLLLSGWLAGAESASWALLQPVVARLDDTPQIRMQQGMLRTFGRVMPVLLPVTSVLIVSTAVVAPAGAPRRSGWSLPWPRPCLSPSRWRSTCPSTSAPLPGTRSILLRDGGPTGAGTHTYQGVRALLLAVWFLCAVAAVTLD
jgi:hypothetical protein